MFLSRVELNPYRRETVKAMSSPQIMHASIMASFNSFEKNDNERVLWRIDRVNKVVYLLVQSSNKPDFHHIIDQYGRPDAEQKWDVMEYDNFLQNIENNQKWRFRLKANPTYCVPSANKRGKVVAHVTVEQQIKWMLSKAEKNGFKVVSNSYGPILEVKYRDIKSFNRNGSTVTISTAVFEGILLVVDADMLRMCIENGIGRAKAYGCGMITLARL